MSASRRSGPGVAFVLSGGASLGAIQVGMLRALAERGVRPVLPPPCPLHVQPMDFGHADELISRAEADARAFLDGRHRRLVLLRRAS